SAVRVIAAVVVLGVCVLGASRARADYISGDVRVYLRAGPGLEFRILKILGMGAPAQKLSGAGEWVQVRVEGVEGWIPAGDLSNEEPPNVALPKVREKLAAAEARASELDQKLSQQTAQLEELASIKERNRVLEDDASRANATARWKTLATGSAITLVGILVGLLAPRGSGTRSRLKL
ncbi:MAG TPA: TIGR04211 family SH3 domain-containing protein, partial [Myxococcota bacterium]|nr:TIGR04211 family SH3 domain-containing protein [Myxococcota bacterium]